MGLLIARKTFGTLLAEAAHMTSMRPLLVLALSPVFLASCGGATSPGSGGSELGQDGGESDAQGTGGSAGGGTAGSSGSGTAGAGGVPGQGGAAGAAGGVACCLAAAICNPGDREIGGPDECPAGASCYQNSICCSTVWCVSEAAQCEAYPVCDPGDRELDGACPPAYSCYARSLCGTTITCLDTLIDGGPAPLQDGGACTPGAEYNRNYVGSSPDQCALIDFICPANTTYFANGCGCGCEQDASCPEFVDCMPGPGTPDPLCGVEGAQRCPYTVRAL